MVGRRDIGIAIQTRVEQVGAGGIEHRDKRRTPCWLSRVDGVVKSRSRQHGIRCRREAGWNAGGAICARISRDISLALRIDCDRDAGLIEMSEKGRIHQASARTEFGQECALRVWAVVSGIDHISANRLVRSRGNRKFGRAGKSGDVGVTGAVDGNGVRSSRRVVVEDTPANISGVDQLRARRVQLGYEARGRVRGIYRLG